MVNKNPNDAVLVIHENTRETKKHAFKQIWVVKMLP